VTTEQKWMAGGAFIVIMLTLFWALYGRKDDPPR
jgi:hypothetical protein